MRRSLRREIPAPLHRIVELWQRCPGRPRCRRHARTRSPAAIYPTVGLFAASHALASVYNALAQGKPVNDPIYAFDDFVDMIGFPTVWDFEKKYADLLAEDQI